MSIDYPALSAWPCGCLIHLGDPDHEGTRTITISTTHDNCPRAALLIHDAELEGIEFHVREVHPPQEPA